MRPDGVQLTGWFRSRLVRGLVAVGSAGVIALGLAHGTTRPSSAAPAPQPTLVGVDAAAMDSRDGSVSRDAGRALSPQLLANARSQRLAQAISELEAGQQANALKSRATALGASASQIAEQSRELNDQSSFLMPTAGGFDTRFGMRMHPILHYSKLHNGDDIGGACNQPIWAAADGVVTKAAMGGYNGGSGNNVRINDGKIGGVRVETAYLHMNSIAVKVGQRVHKGELLGRVGSTGLSTACHLHFSVYGNGAAIAPKKYLGK